MIEKAAKLFGDVKTIYGFLFLVCVGGYNVVTWAGDQRYLTVASYEQNQAKSDIRRLNNKIAELRIRLQYATKQRDKDMIRSLIINTETQIKNLKGE